MTIKITITSDYEDAKRHFHSNRLLLLLLPKQGFNRCIFLCLASYFSPSIIGSLKIKI